MVKVCSYSSDRKIGCLLISDKKYKKILADRVKRIKENEKLKQEMMKDQDLVEEVKQNTKKLMQ